MDFREGLDADAGMPDQDLVLVREFASGQTDAFDRLYHRHCTFIYNTCVGILGNPDDARDAMQDTFVQLWRSLPRFREQSKFSTWLYRIAVNKCMDLSGGNRGGRHLHPSISLIMMVALTGTAFLSRRSGRPFSG